MQQVHRRPSALKRIASHPIALVLFAVLGIGSAQQLYQNVLMWGAPVVAHFTMAYCDMNDEGRREVAAEVSKAFKSQRPGMTYGLSAICPGGGE